MVAAAAAAGRCRALAVLLLLLATAPSRTSAQSPASVGPPPDPELVHTVFSAECTPLRRGSPQTHRPRPRRPPLTSGAFARRADTSTGSRWRSCGATGWCEAVRRGGGVRPLAHVRATAAAQVGMPGPITRLLACDEDRLKTRVAARQPPRARGT